MFIRAGDDYLNVAQITRATRVSNGEWPALRVTIGDAEIVLYDLAARDAIAVLDACCIAVPADDAPAE